MRNLISCSFRNFPKAPPLVLLLAAGWTTALHGQVATTTQLTIPIATVGVGVPTQLTATVSAAGHGVNLGTVTFYDGARSLGSAQIVSGTSGEYPHGTANLKTASFLTGANSITAVFAGTASDSKSTSSAKTVTVTGKKETATVLTGYVTGTNYYLTAALRAFGSGTPTGNVVFASPSVGTIASKSLGGAAWKNDIVAGSAPATGTAPSGAATGDFNGDGFLDFATSNTGHSPSTSSISVLLGKGDGSFQPQVMYPETGNTPGNIYAADFNNDGRLDLALVYQVEDEYGNIIGGAIGILLGNGDGTFQPQINYGSIPAGTAYIGDFNRDGQLDIAFPGETASGTGLVAVLLGNGDGTFQTEKSYVAGTGAAVAFGTLDITGGDLNGDGIPDLITTSTAGESVLLGKGDGSFLAQKTYVLGSGSGIALADLNGDGKLDVVLLSDDNDSANAVTHGQVGTVGVSLGKGDGTFAAAQTYPLSGNPEYNEPLLVDFNQDGKLDIVTGVFQNNLENTSNIQLLLGDGDGTFQHEIAYLQNLQGMPKVIGDFNGDGWPDLVSPNYGYGKNVANVFLNARTTSVQLVKSGLAAGTTTVTADYSGDSAFAGSDSNAVALSPHLTPAPNYPGSVVIPAASAANLLLNGSASIFNTVYSSIALENGESSQAGSVFYAAPQNVQAFTTEFQFQTCCGPGSGDGLTFTIQNQGPQALGGSGGSLGYAGIAKSVAVKFDYYNNNGEGTNSTGLYKNGGDPTVPDVDVTSSGVKLAGDYIQAKLVYDGTTLTLTLLDEDNNKTFSHAWLVDIPTAVGGTHAYVGFTGGTGGRVSGEDLFSWTYTPASAN